MADDYTNVPRRLRRFYRKGQPVPEEKINNGSKPAGEEVLDNEPWMKSSSKGSPPTPVPAMQPPRFEKILEETQKPGATPMDHALGLSDKAKFEERLPQGGEKAIQDNSGKKEEIAHTLQELKELAQNNKEGTEQGPTSFHFTPVGGAPNAASPEERARAALMTPLPSSAMSPRERMEMRRQRTGAAPGEESQPQAPANSNPAAEPNQGGTAHIRRRMGQVMSGQEEMETNTPTPASSKNTPSQDDDMGDFKDLFNESKKKKTKKDDDDDMSLDDMPMLEDDK